MRLLHTETSELKEFLGDNIPEYAILSHTWDEQEVTFQDMSAGPAKEKKLGWRKIQFCCRQAIQDGFSWAWIDTCCIDKTSSAELSESINSMYEWYKKSRICYVYLQDCYKWKPFSESRWWKRGWTLQELIAPSRVWFYDANWEEIGSKRSMHEEVTRITGIDEDILTGGDIFKRNVAVRMSWAADRKTTRIEDEAYCLLGLFGVNMPLLYGEGNRAFKRLQEEILKVTEDYTLFTWLRFGRYSKGLLASAPRNFNPRVFQYQLASRFDAPASLQCDMGNLSHDCFSIFPPPQNYETPYMTSRGLHLTLPTWQPHNRDQSVKVCITLSKRNNAVELVCVSLHRLSLDMMERSQYDDDLTFLPESELIHFSYKTFYVIEPRHEASVPEVSTDEDAPTILIIKLNGTYSERLSCYFSPWPSMMDLLQLDSVSDGEELVPPQVHTIQGPRPVDVPSLFAGIGISSDDNDDDIVWYFPKAQDFSRHGKFDQCLGKFPEHCWFVHKQDKLATSGDTVKSVLCFGLKGIRHSKFQIQIKISESNAFCQVLPTTTEALQNEANRQKWLRAAEKATFSTDRTTIQLSSPIRDSEFPWLRFAVSIRQVATSSHGFRRYVLSISDVLNEGDA